MFRVTILKKRKRKSLNKNSQIRDLPIHPLSNSVDARGHIDRASLKKIEFGKGMFETGDYHGLFQSLGREAGGPTREFR
jgi:hypothetical protein